MPKSAGENAVNVSIDVLAGIDVERVSRLVTEHHVRSATPRRIRISPDEPRPKRTHNGVTTRFEDTGRDR